MPTKGYVLILALDLRLDGWKDRHGRLAGTGPSVVVLHGQRREARWCAQFMAYGPPLGEPRAQGERGAEGELTKTENKGGGPTTARGSYLNPMAAALGL